MDTIHIKSGHSCTRCARRKVKCDRQRPCTACKKHEVTCTYEISSEISEHRRKRLKQQVLIERLHNCESILASHGLKEQISARTESQARLHNTEGQYLRSSSPVGTTDQSSEYPHRLNKVQIIHSQGRSRLINNSLWTRIIEELDEQDDISSHTSDIDSISDKSEIDYGLPLLDSLESLTHNIVHPSVERINDLWQIYVDRFDPLTKVIHVPTISTAMIAATKAMKAVPKSLEALMFAIYAAAVATLRDDECQSRFGESRKKLLARYTLSTRICLSRVHFMGTTSLLVLQALVLHLLASRHVLDHRTLWTFTGIALRIARIMGLDRDGEALGLTPFQTEIRRRIWWLLQAHDAQIAELCGMPKFCDIDTGDKRPKIPVMISDAELRPDATISFHMSAKLSDGIFIAARYELSNFAASQMARFRAQRKDSSQWELHALSQDLAECREAFQQLEESLEAKYIRYCDPSEPLQLMTMLTLRVAFNVLKFLMNHPRKWQGLNQIPNQDKQMLWKTSLRILEQLNMSMTNPLLEQFAWHSRLFLHLPSFIHVLDNLRVDPMIHGADRVWSLLCSTYENTHYMMSSFRSYISISIRKLCLKAYDAREAAFKANGMVLPQVPDLILKFREQQANSIEKRTSSTNLEKCTKGVSDPSGPIRPDLPETQVANHSILDPFWFVDDFAHEEKMGEDLLRPEDHGEIGSPRLPVDCNFDEISWAQWDAWLSGSEVPGLITPARSVRQNLLHGQSYASGQY